MDEEALREKARSTIESGKLPNRNPDRTWTGVGARSTISICR